MADSRSPESQRSGPSRALQYARPQALSSAFNRWSNGPAQDRRNGDNLLGVEHFRPASSQAESTRTLDHTTSDHLPQKTPQTAFKSVRHSLQEDPEEEGENGETPVVPRPSVLSMLDTWRRAAGIQKTSEASQTRSPRSSQTPDRSVTRSSQHAIAEAHEDGTVQPATAATGQELVSSLRGDDAEGSQQSVRGVVSSQLEEHSPRPDTRSPTPRPLGHEIIPETPHPEHSKAGLSSSEIERLMHLASRARQIFLASKVFNHWADKTARRLEREAVARRHMIRFRCFRGWCQAPDLQGPAVHRLRITTAAQKLRRAVAEHEEQLRLAALAASETRRLKTVQKVLDMWARHKAESEARLRIAQRTRIKAATQWFGRAREEVVAKEYLVEQHKRSSQDKVVRDWSHLADTGVARAAAAKKIGDFRVSFTYLATWWDQAEIKRRSEEYRRRLLVEKSSHCFTLWNLQARAQAFIWRNQYVTVNRVFDMWYRMAQEDLYQHDQVRLLSETRYKVKVSDVIAGVAAQQSEMSRLSSRASLYINATRVLAVFERAAEQNKTRHWNAIKRHLQRRYEQVSARRKQRAFFAALDSWRSAAFRAQLQTDRAKQISSARQTSEREAALSIWADACANASNREYEAQVYHAQTSLAKWSKWTEGEEQLAQQLEVMVLSDKRRLYYRNWAMSSLQQSGLGHTAAMAAEKYEREKRRRTLQKWRHHSDKGKKAVASSAFSSPQRGARTAPAERPKSAFKARPPTQRVLFASQGHDGRGQAGSIPDTPTRWTGRPLFAKSVMSPLQEADEEDAAAPVKPREEHTSASLASMLKGVKRTPMKLPWPTPDAIMSGDVIRQPRLPRIFGVMTPSTESHTQQSAFGGSEPTITGRAASYEPDQPPPSTWRRPPPLRRQSLPGGDRAGPSQSKLSRTTATAGGSTSEHTDTPAADSSVHGRSTIRPLSGVRSKIPQTTHIIRTSSPNYPKDFYENSGVKY